MKQRVVLAGANGFIGKHLTTTLLQAGYDVVALTRSAASGVQWDGKTVGPWATSLEGAQAVINLAGAPINGRWTPEYLQELRDSRILPTRAIAEAIKGCATPPKFWVNCSAIGYYGDAVYEPADEQTAAGNDFLAELCRDWEREALDSGAPTQVRIVRTGFVLGIDGGALPILLKLTRGFLGGAVGTGKQVVGWIHIGDLCRMFVAAASLAEWPTVVNGTAPKPATNSELMRTLRRIVGRPWVPGPPAFVMKGVSSLSGQSAALLALASQNAVPSAAIAATFPFEHPVLEEALRNLIR